VTDVAGNALDGDWSARDGGIIDIYSDDPPVAIPFDVSNGTAGSPDYDLDNDREFRLHFALLAGDYNGDGVVIGDLDDIALRDAQVILNAKLPLLAAGGDFMDDE